MSELHLRLFYVITDLLAPLIVGYVLHQKGWMTERINNLLIRAGIMVFMTLLAILSFWVLPLSMDVLLLPVFGILYTLIPGILAKLFFMDAYSNTIDKGAYLMASMLSNIGILTGLCAFLVYGETGYAYVQLIATFQNMLFIALCLPLAQYYRAKANAEIANTRLRISWRMLFNWNQLGVLGMVLGVMLNLSGVERPVFFGDVFFWFIHVNAWSALLPLGYLLDFSKARTWYRQVISLVPLHFILLPACIFVPACMIFENHVLLNTLLLASMAPVGINSVLAAQLYSLNVDFNIAAFLLTTTVFLFLVFPLFFFWVL